MSHVHEPGTAASDAINRYINSGLFNSEFRMNARKRGALDLSACRASRCGPVDVLLCEGGGPRHTRRALRHIRADHADDILVVVPLKARVMVSQRGVTEQVLPDGFACLATSRPLYAITSALDPHDCFSLYLVRIPAPLLRKQLPDIDECCGRFIPALQGAGKIMLHLFGEALTEGPLLTEAQRQRLGTMLIDATVNAIVATHERERATPRADLSGGAKVHARACAYIAAHLSKSTLAAAEIAAHCGTSRRYVDMAFAERGETLGAVIRESRLQACREELADRSLDHKAIAEIAFRWGFTDPAYFSRAYKTRFGHAPTMERKKPASSPRASSRANDVRRSPSIAAQ